MLRSFFKRVFGAKVLVLTNQREESIEGQIRECTAFAEKNQLATGNTCLVLMIRTSF